MARKSGNSRMPWRQPKKRVEPHLIGLHLDSYKLRTALAENTEINLLKKLARGFRAEKGSEGFLKVTELETNAASIVVNRFIDSIQLTENAKKKLKLVQKLVINATYDPRFRSRHQVFFKADLIKFLSGLGRLSKLVLDLPFKKYPEITNAYRHQLEVFANDFIPQYIKSLKEKKHEVVEVKSPMLLNVPTVASFLVDVYTKHIFRGNEVLLSHFNEARTDIVEAVTKYFNS